MALSDVKLEKMEFLGPFLGLPWAKMVRNVCFYDKYALSDPLVENRQLKDNKKLFKHAKVQIHIF